MSYDQMKKWIVIIFLLSPLAAMAAQPYQLTNNSLAPNAQIIIRADVANIPPDPRNTDYRAYLQWLAAGNTPDVAPPLPPPVVMLTFLQFMALFTGAEQVAIVNSTDTQVKLFILMATGSSGIQLSNPQTIAGVNYLTTSGSPPILTTAEAARILAGTPPT